MDLTPCLILNYTAVIVVFVSEARTGAPKGPCKVARSAVSGWDAWAVWHHRQAKETWKLRFPRRGIAAVGSRDDLDRVTSSIPDQRPDVRRSETDGSWSKSWFGRSIQMSRTCFLRIVFRVIYTVDPPRSSQLLSLLLRGSALTQMFQRIGLSYGWEGTALFTASHCHMAFSRRTLYRRLSQDWRNPWPRSKSSPSKLPIEVLFAWIGRYFCSNAAILSP